ncbi:MAG: hypothetical protein COU06_01030 [Candidatus Harrisonbacteria bacterium CG10_big_fil_rev_8_21_14_0_10_38_8]|uniref:Uncharacterized protein n=1 Tax=Candidatus Harrisonbacteria bacterium CG10_big_fil_rev_8_21_14_0_10_38_8 TaxID=1974582 RepID=A0A2M6WKD0_9BACT|nr:MAG: hypothetical protein COU06_01030 [Candidatus Harrisonbacteria bacterium CG10_big_fil_rev_8_21_14_0_10_38_8]
MNWLEDHLNRLKEIQSLEEMLSLAFEVIDRISIPITQVCGPISTGGLGSMEANISLFKKTTKRLHNEGFNIFDQIPFESAILKINKDFRDKDEYVLLNNFYLPIFESRKIHTLAFLPDWQSSLGSTWEHETGKKLNLNIIYL